jgi:MoaA/NifB/PqqE/SkfB family radical SAM enzyme
MCSYPNKEIYPFLQIKIDNECNKSCEHCIEGDELQKKTDFDYDKLNSILNEFDKQTKYNLSITGGEPTLKKERLFKVLDIIDKQDGVNDFNLNTNGYNLEKCIDRINDSKINYVNIGINDINSDLNIKNIVKKLKKKIRINCLILSDIIDNENKIKQFVKHYKKQGIKSFAFISIANYKDEIFRNQRIRYKDIVTNLNGIKKDCKYCTCEYVIYSGCEILFKDGDIKLLAQLRKNENYSLIRNFVFNSNNLYDDWDKHYCIV